MLELGCIQLLLQVDPISFTLILDYIYQGHMQVPNEQLSSVMLLAQQCGLSYLEHQLDMKLNENKSFGEGALC